MVKVATVGLRLWTAVIAMMLNCGEAVGCGEKQLRFSQSAFVCLVLRRQKVNTYRRMLCRCKLGEAPPEGRCKRVGRSQLPVVWGSTSQGHQH